MVLNLAKFFKFMRQLIYLSAVLSLIFAKLAIAVLPPGVSFSVTVVPAGSGTGTVTSSPGGINCPGECTASFTTTVTLSATQTNGSTFADWSGGGCSGFGTCTVSSDATVTATFNSPPPPPPPGTATLTVASTNPGSGVAITVSPLDNSSQGSGTTQFSRIYNSDAVVSLTAPASTGGNSFQKWQRDGMDVAFTTTTSVTMDADHILTAVYASVPPPPSFSVTVVPAGSGTGTVTSSPGGINCPGTCTAPFSTTVTLNATTTNGSTFGGWSGGGCSGFGTCTVSTTQTVIATFNPPNQLLDLTATIATIPSSGAVGDAFQLSASVSNQGFGAAGAFALGAYFSTDATIDTGDLLFAACDFTGLAPGDSLTCSGTVHFGTSTTPLSPGVYFVGVIADYLNVVTESDKGNNTAVTGPVTVTGSSQVSDLTVAMNGSGTGTVTSDQGGIMCGSGNSGTCSTTLTNGTSVALTATPTSPATFGGWGGDCAFAGTATTCALTMYASQSVSATFNPPSFTFSLSVGVPASGTGTGTVTSDQGGIMCGSGNSGTCSTTLTNGTSVALTATPTSPATFGGWGGDCAFAGTATTCALTMYASQSVSATFTAVPPPPPSPVVFSPSKDIWTTNVYSYAPGGGGPGGGLNDDTLRIGGWSDEYRSLLQFDLSGAPSVATSVTLRLYDINANGGIPVSMYIDRVTSPWDWTTQAITPLSPDNQRLWWVNRPSFTQLGASPLTAPSVGNYYDIDLTNLYNQWQSGALPNYGVQLRPISTNNNFNIFASSENAVAAWRPQLTVVGSTGPPNPPGTATLTVTPPSNGTVTGPGINCPGDCSESYGSGASVSLTATPAPGFTFGGFGGDPDCADGILAMNADTHCTATFTSIILPDLTGTWNPVSQSCRKGKCKLKGSVRIVNQGTATASASRLRILLSDDATLDPSDAVLKETKIKKLRPGREKKSKIKVTLPAGVSASAKYLFAIIDTLDLVVESDETNNSPSTGPMP